MVTYLKNLVPIKIFNIVKKKCQLFQTHKRNGIQNNIQQDR